MVKKGQELGVIGNSGNAVSPHLHMQVSDGPNPFGSNSVPYVIDQFAYKGKIADMQQFDKNEVPHAPHHLIPATSEATVKNVLPGEGTILSFQ